MKFNVKQCRADKDGNPQGKPWVEELKADTDDPEKYARGVLDSFNDTLREGEKPRIFISVEVIGTKQYKEHDWHKTNLTSISEPGLPIYDTYICTVCKITGKRFGLEAQIRRDKKYKDKKYQYCKEDDVSDRKIILGILDRMKVDYTSKISSDRARKKLARAIEKGGMPEIQTEAEAHVLHDIGYKIEFEKPAKETIPRADGLACIFRDLWEEKDEWTRAEIIARLVENGTIKSKWTALNYIAMAKKDSKLLGAKLEEVKKDGKKYLRIQK